MQLDLQYCLKNCSIKVAKDDWETKPPEQRSRHATLHRGTCLRCRKSMEKMKDKQPHLQDVATFSARNNFDPLFGLDTGAAYREWLYLSQHATVVESMLVALNHMQVSVCNITLPMGLMSTTQFQG